MKTLYFYNRGLKAQGNSSEMVQWQHYYSALVRNDIFVLFSVLITTNISSSAGAVVTSGGCSPSVKLGNSWKIDPLYQDIARRLIEH